MIGRKLISKTVVLLFFMPFVYPNTSQGIELDDALRTLRQLCAADHSYSVESDGGAGLSILRRGLKGDFSYSEKERNGFLGGVDEAIRAEQNDKIRECMRREGPKLLDLALGLEGDRRLSEPDELSTRVSNGGNHCIRISDATPLGTKRVAITVEYIGEGTFCSRIRGDQKVFYKWTDNRGRTLDSDVKSARFGSRAKNGQSKTLKLNAPRDAFGIEVSVAR